MFGLGMSEIIFLAVLALIVIGPKQLPEVARTLGRFLNELKRSTNVLSEEIKQQTRFDELNLRDHFLRPQPPKPPMANNENVIPVTAHPEPTVAVAKIVTPPDAVQLELTAQAHEEEKKS